MHILAMAMPESETLPGSDPLVDAHVSEAQDYSARAGGRNVEARGSMGLGGPFSAYGVVVAAETTFSGLVQPDLSHESPIPARFAEVTLGREAKNQCSSHPGVQTSLISLREGDPPKNGELGIHPLFPCEFDMTRPPSSVAGGDNISVTKGVVSRVEPTQYVHGSTMLMAIQIDAAINPGNSGGPAIMGDKVAGVAFQNLSGAENIGYIIPVPVIKQFIVGVEERGKYVGFCSLGLTCQRTENVQLREHFHMRPDMTGVLVSKINPLSKAHGILKEDDIVLAFDGVPIANDGTVPFRNRERITFDHLVSMKKPNEIAEVEILRGGVEHKFSITLQPLQPLVPVHQFDKLPSYFIFAGLVFVPLTQPYLHEYGEDWYNTSPRRLCERALRELPKKAGEQLVILSQVLMDDINAGYERLTELQVMKVNGVEVENLKHLRQLVEDCSEESLRFDLDDRRVAVLNYELAKVATSRILKRHRIPSAMSSDLNEPEGQEMELAFMS
ncbi:hypothetical protein HHK36_013387 [Tetracentron sinense]|uniref:Uncharacterized protein n=1 Tax=Tetracentron sinense TaxID=13715 RepID=A0A834ZAL4_TETSI|nr:hypothetical protein HHK36_013387 [Tetracentron sinense]